MSMYSHTFNEYEFLPGDVVTIRLKKEPYDGIVVRFTGQVTLMDETSLTEEGVKFEYLVESVPDGIKLDELEEQEFVNCLGAIILGWIERHFEENGPTETGVIGIHAPVEEAAS